jgi:hypothetical protein
MNTKSDSRQNFPANAEQENGPLRFRREQVAAVAYQLYVRNGCRDGHDREDWFQAEQQLKESTSRIGMRTNAGDGEIERSALEAANQSRLRANEKTERTTATGSQKTRGTAKDSPLRQTTTRGEARGPQSPPAIRQSARTR